MMDSLYIDKAEKTERIYWKDVKLGEVRLESYAADIAKKQKKDGEYAFSLDVESIIFLLKI